MEFGMTRTNLSMSISADGDVAGAFHFVTDGIEAAYAQAQAAAGDRDLSIAGGASCAPAGGQGGHRRRDRFGGVAGDPRIR